MNRNLLFAVLLFTIYSCTDKPDQKAGDTVQIKSVNTVVDPKEQKLQSLRSSPAIDLEELKGLLPEKINDIKRSHYSVSNAMGYGMAHADYEKNSKTDIRITYYDCSGDAGAGIFESIYWSRLNKPKEDETSILKTIDFGGAKALEKFDKDTKVTTITFLANDRVLVIISGRNIEASDLKESIKTLPLKVV